MNSVLNMPGVKRVWAALPQARIVGGAVRDSLAGIAVSDIDFAIPLPPDQIMQAAAAAKLKIIPTGLAHGTVTVIADGISFEVTSLRRDVETDGRWAIVSFVDDWRVDASRRDFTINAMSMDQAGEIFDYFGGQDDLKLGVVKFVGQARARIEEDYLRVFRYFRFFARYSKSEPDKEAIESIGELACGVSGLSTERIWTELKKILIVKDITRTVSLMSSAGVLKFILMTPNPEKLIELIGYGAPPEPILRMAALAGISGTKEMQRLKLSGDEQARFAALLRPIKITPDSSMLEIRRALADSPVSIVIDRTWLDQDKRPGWAELRDQLAAIGSLEFPLQGRNILVLGMSEGPQIGRVLDAVRQWWLEAGCVADTQQCIEKARQIISGSITPS